MSERYGEFSNFPPFPIRLKNRRWPTTEHYFQAQKFAGTPHEELKELLLGTGEARIIEHTTNDSYWGDGGDGSGLNTLGQLLMRLRSELRAS